MALALPDQAKGLELTLTAALSELGIVAAHDQRERLVAYLALLQRWNAVHNLSATQDAAGLLRQHVIDCLAIVSPLVRHANGEALEVLDAGTGAGLPAVVLAIMLPHWSLTAVDAVAKKVAFLRQVRGELEIANLHPQHARLEHMSSSTGAQFDVVTSRAFSSLRHLVEATRHLLAPGGVWAAMKGKPPETEARDLPPNCQLFHVEPVDVPGLSANRCLVWMRPIEPAVC